MCPCAATQTFPHCVQGNPLLYTNEDCLLLNVFTPLPSGGAQPSAASDSGNSTAPPLLPVIVFIHGGGYLTGSVCDTLELSGRFLAPLAVPDTSGAAHGAVVIEPQYRLGVLGFLGGDALRRGGGATAAAGNYGVLDTRLALQWARDNARSFGGDPARVLLAGQSAGAGMVAAHTVR